MPKVKQPEMMVERNSKGKLSRVPHTNDGRGLVPVDGRFDKPYNEYLEELNPKGKDARSVSLRFALASSTDVRFREFLIRLGEPRYKNYTLAGVAKSCDISLPNFADFWQKAQHSRAVARAQEAMYEITCDMAEDARTQTVNCDRCDGLGFIAAEQGMDPLYTPGLKQQGARVVRPCPTCFGKGVRRIPGDQESRKNLMQMTGHAARGGAAIQINQTFGSMESAVAKMNQVTFAIEDDADVIDVSTVSS